MLHLRSLVLVQDINREVTGTNCFPMMLKEHGELGFDLVQEMLCHIATSRRQTSPNDAYMVDISCNECGLDCRMSKLTRRCEEIKAGCPRCLANDFNPPNSGRDVEVMMNDPKEAWEEDCATMMECCVCQHPVFFLGPEHPLFRYLELGIRGYKATA